MATREKAGDRALEDTEDSPRTRFVEVSKCDRRSRERFTGAQAGIARPLRVVGALFPDALRNVDQALAQIVLEVAEDGAQAEGLDQIGYLMRPRPAARGDQHQVYGYGKRRSMVLGQLLIGP